MIVLFLQHKGFRYIEALVASLILVIGVCFAYEIVIASPELGALFEGLLPRPEIVTNPGMLYVAIGILGATVMPHNLYLHSSIVQTRAFERNEAGKATAIRFATIDSTVALGFAFFINAAILIVSAATFFGTSYANVETIDINEGYRLLQRVLGPMASTVFALALLASGQNSTLTGTMAGQIVMEGFLNLRLRPWVRRLLTRMVAIVPAVVVAVLYGEHGEGALLVLSQVILSMQLSFAVIPLVQFTSDRRKMGAFANGPHAVGRGLDRDGNHRIIERLFAGQRDGRTGPGRLDSSLTELPATEPCTSTFWYHSTTPPRTRRSSSTSADWPGFVGARLTLVHVADGFMARNQERLNLDESDEMREDRAYLERRRAELAGEGFTVDAVLACGEPTSHIVALAESKECDLIAMSTHGHRLIADMILGSVANEVRHRTEIPVLLVRAPRKG